MTNGNATKLAFAKETTFGTAVTPTKQIQFSNSDFRDNIDKVEDGLLTGGKTGGKVETMGIGTEGTLSTLAKPETIGHILKGVLGLEGTVSTKTIEVTGKPDVTKYVHTFTAIGNAENDYLPSYTFTFDRKVKTTAYTGMTFNTLSFSAAQQDYLKVDCNLIGYASETGNIPNTVTFETNRALKFHQASVFIGGTEYEATNIKFDYNNNLSAIRTTKTGLHTTHPQQGKRDITSELEVIFNPDSEAIRNSYWLTDDTFGIKIEFEDDEHNKLTIEIPCCQITAFDDPAASGDDVLKQTISLKAVESTSELITVTLENDVETAY